MRYCVTGDTLVRTARGHRPDRRHRAGRGAELRHRHRPQGPSTATATRSGRRKFFHSGEHPTLKLRTREGYELTGTHNHPVLCLVNRGSACRPCCGSCSRRSSRATGWSCSAPWRPSSGYPPVEAIEAAVLAGAFVSEGWVSENTGRLQQRRPGVLRPRARGLRPRPSAGRATSSERTIASGSTLYELDIQNLERSAGSVLGDLVGAAARTSSCPSSSGRRCPP